MEYILQIFTGGWQTANYTAEAITHRLSVIMEKLPVRAVLIGWNIDADLYRTVGEFLHSRQKEMILWLPVFSETDELKQCDPLVDLFGNPVGHLALQEGENFQFCCPLSVRNLHNVEEIYEEYFADCPFDGIFLDKIRTQSFVGGVSGVLSCGCPACQKIYQKHGFSLPAFAEHLKEAGDALLETCGYEAGKGFVFKDPMTEEFFTQKGQYIAESIQTLCRYFHARGLQVGLDLYAPLLSRFTGQSYREICKEADFIKPMLYRRTEAPAGIGYEYRLLLQHLPHTRQYPKRIYDDAFLKQQVNEFTDLPCKKYPGIEINYREDIARTDPSYIRESLHILEESGMDGAVLAWDCMLAPDSHIDACIR